MRLPAPTGPGAVIIPHPRLRDAHRDRELDSQLASLDRGYDQLEAMLVNFEAIAAPLGERYMVRLARSYRAELRALRAIEGAPDKLAERLRDLLDELREFSAWFERYRRAMAHADQS